MKSSEIRKSFLDFFASKQHLIVPSAPMVVKNDPTLMFTNAGMNQFKDYFLGNAAPQVSRIADAQKCLRVSGKQNDLEEVGHDTYHHTMFEMLGNWSFGDYFKEQAIEWAWEFLVDVLRIDPERLYATVFEGDAKENLHMDEESYELWGKHLPHHRILKDSAKNNFWEMGETGPCGPCSEIHIDLRPDSERAAVPGASLVNQDNPLVIEIWNLVFIQYNRNADGSLTPLPAKHVDTGMGLERLCMVLQGKRSNYDTDLFQPLIASFANRAGISYGHSGETDVALRVVADHLRAVAFSIADGQLPSNNKAGYVIRRILRRAVRYGYSFLGFREPFLHLSVGTLVDLMHHHYPEILVHKELIIKVIREEEISFLRTLESGIHLLETLITSAQQASNSQIAGKDAFTLYDTYGFPLDLTQLILREKGMSVDLDEFERCMEVQKHRSRSDAAVTTGDWQVFSDTGVTEFLGYDSLESEVRIQRMRQVVSKGKKVFHIVLDKSPFYAESGGQLGDVGTLSSPHESIRVLDVVRENALQIHIVDRLPENPEATFHAQVDADARQATTCHHTATHLLHHALREVLGSHVEQKGSQVGASHLRFDFSHFQRLTSEEVRRVEEIVNAMSRSAICLEEHRDVSMLEAQAMGALALFGEKYGDSVRVIRYGDSVELCGGTHLANTGSIGLFRIISEGAISAGVRRIEAVAGRVAELQHYALSDQLAQIDELLHAQGKPLEAVNRLKEEASSLKKRVEELRLSHLHSLADELLKTAETRGEFTVIERVIPNMPADDLRELAQILRAQESLLMAVVLGSVVEGKPSLVIALSQELSQRNGMHAGTVIREAAKAMQGGGGGQAGLATAGGKNPDALPKAVQRAAELLGL